MDSQERDKTENETAFRIRRIREAFTEARNKAALKDSFDDFNDFHDGPFHDWRDVV
jgi:hypothetical protein